MQKCFRLIVFFWVSTAAGLVSVKAQNVDFEKQIWPILEAKCVDCHKAPFEENGRTKKPKAGLRLDGAWAIMMGSENGAVVSKGHSDESELYLRTTLPEDDDEFMPPTGKADPLTDKEKELLAKWIDQGSNFGGWAGNLEGKPKEIANTGLTIPKSEIQELYKSLSEGLSQVPEEKWKDVTAAGGRVMPLARTSPLLSVDFRLTAEDATDEKVATISAVADQVAHLDLSKTQITDATLDMISGMDKLVRLDLHKTAVSDANLKKLKSLKNLRYLNLYGTQVSDAGLKDLGEIKSLKSVYLWNSNATQKGVRSLGKALPEAKVNFD